MMGSHVSNIYASRCTHIVSLPPCIDLHSLDWLFEHIMDVPKSKASKYSESMGANAIKPEEVDTAPQPSWKQFTQNTTLHGVKYIFDGRSLARRYLELNNSHKYIMIAQGNASLRDIHSIPAVTLFRVLNHFCADRLFWLLIVLGAMAFFISQVVLRTIEYYKYQTVISVKRIRSDNVSFPAVTLCNLNQFR